MHQDTNHSGPIAACKPVYLKQRLTSNSNQWAALTCHNINVKNVKLKETPSTSYSSGDKIFLGYTGSHYMLLKPQDDFISTFQSGLQVVHDVRNYLCILSICNIINGI